jgi:hypothetical protein
MALYHNFGVFPAAKALQSRRSQTFTWQMQVSKWCVGELWICEFEESDEMATLYRWQPSSTYFNGLFVAQQMTDMPKTHRGQEIGWSLNGPLDRSEEHSGSPVNTELVSSDRRGRRWSRWWSLMGDSLASKTEQFCTWMKHMELSHQTCEASPADRSWRCVNQACNLRSMGKLSAET